jgi:predicted ATPase
MYLRFEVIRQAIRELQSLHPFFGLTYLVCKKARLPVGDTVSFAINHIEEEFLKKYFRPDPTSRYFFQPFRTSSGRWLSPKYASSGSQKTRTSGRLSKAFIHPRNTAFWGWAPDYIQVLKAELMLDNLAGVPAFWLAAWLYRHSDFPSSLVPSELEKRLFSDFHISPEERKKLFADSEGIPSEIFTDEPYSDRSLFEIVGAAPDHSPEEGGILRLLEMRNVGPVRHLQFNPAERLSVITGDNGLGKTFILECAWWSLTDNWADRPAYPNPQKSKIPASITFEIAAPKTRSGPNKIQYDWQNQEWPAPKNRPTLPGLVVYARVDGSFAVWDPARHSPKPHGQRTAAMVFSRDQVLRGFEGQIEGLLRDWVRWQNSKDQHQTFETFCAVLRKLSPPDMSPLTPGSPVRIPGESREIPTLQHSYGLVPFINESAGVRRIVTLAYLLVWSWAEHQVYSELTKRAPQRQLVILIDEVEAHLHPKWQRVALPALLDVATILSKDLQHQAIVATHSPLILASIETRFSPDVDKLFHLHLSSEGQVAFAETPFIRYGSVDKWLTSDIFELPQARSRESERVLEEAEELLSQKTPDLKAIRRLSEQLKEALPEDDQFWPRWVFFAEMNGVKL